MEFHMSNALHLFDKELHTREWRERGLKTQLKLDKMSFNKPKRKDKKAEEDDAETI